MTEQKMKRQFIKQNFLMLFTAFIIPVLIAGLIIIGITISDSKNETKDKLNRSLRIIYDDFDSMYNNYEAIRRFTENTSPHKRNVCSKDGVPPPESARKQPPHRFSDQLQSTGRPLRSIPLSRFPVFSGSE